MSSPDDDPLSLLGLCEGIEVEFPRPLPPHSQRLMDALGVRTLTKETMTMPPCKNGCGREALQTHGRYGMLCSICKFERQRADLAAGSGPPASAGDGRAPGPAPSSKPRSLEAAAKAVVPIAKKLETSARKKKAATSALRADVAAFNAALKELREAGEAILQA